MTVHQRLGPADAAVLETFVVPRYLALFGEPVLDMFLSSSSSEVAHLGCRTGYPDQQLGERIDAGTLIGTDPSPSAIELARTKASLLPTVAADYRVEDSFPTSLPTASFTHAFMLHPPSAPAQRGEVLSEMSRLLVPRGQMLIALPMRGSFQEVLDLLREYALKHDASDLGKAIDRGAAARPNLETLTEEIEAAGFDDVEIDLRPTSLEFQSGRDFIEDPVTRLLILPDVKALVEVGDWSSPLQYLRDAIDGYWSEGRFELSVNIGCVSARRVA